MKMFRSLLTKAVAINVAAVSICMLLLITSTSNYLSGRFNHSFETNSSLFTAFLSNQINTGTRLKRGAMIEPQILSALDTEGLAIDLVRVIHTDGTPVIELLDEAADPGLRAELPPPDFSTDLTATDLGDGVLVRLPIILGAGADAITVGELAVVWNRDVVAAQIASLRTKLIQYAAIAAAALAVATILSLIALAVRPLKTFNRALQAITQDQGELILPRATSVEIVEIRKSLEYLHRMSQERSELLANLTKTVTAARAGDFSERLGGDNEVAAKIDDLLSTTQENLTSTRRVLADLARGDLTARMRGEYHGEFAMLQSHVNETADALGDAIGRIAGSAGTVAGKSLELSNSVQDLSERTQHAAASLEESAAAITSVSDDLKSSEAATELARTHAKDAIDRAAAGQAIVEDAMARMADIANHSKEIGQIISMIDDVAFQTNLLALNAGVEAARAGEAGRGFAVVAQEVRMLAQRASQSAADIKGLITKSASEVDAGVGMVEKAGDAIREIVTVIGALSESVSSVADHTSNQASSINEVSTAIQSLDLATQHNASMVMEASEIANEMQESSADMIGATERFQVAGPSSTSQPPLAA